MSSASPEELLSQVADRESSLVTLLTQQQQQIANALAQIANLHTAVASLTSTVHAQATEISDLKATVRNSESLGTPDSTPRGLMTPPASQTPSIIIRSVTGGLRARRRNDPDGGDEAIEELVIELGTTNSASSRSVESEGSSDSIARPIAPALAAAAARPSPTPPPPTPLVGQSEAPSQATHAKMPRSRSPPRAISTESPAPAPAPAAKVVAFAGVTDDAPMRQPSSSSASTTPPDSADAGPVNIRWAGTPTPNDLKGARKPPREFVSHKPKGPTLPRSLQKDATPTATATTRSAPPPTPVARQAAPSPPAPAPTPQAPRTPPPPPPTPAAPAASGGDGAPHFAVAAATSALHQTYRLQVPATGFGHAADSALPVASCVAMGSDGRCVIAGFDDGKLHMWGRGRATPSCKFVHCREIYSSPFADGSASSAVYDLAFRGNLLLTANADGYVRAVRAHVDEDKEEEEEGDDDEPLEPDVDFYMLRAMDECTETVRNEQSAVACVALPPEPTTPCHTSGDGADAAHGALPPSWGVSGGFDGYLYVWDIDSADCLQKTPLGANMLQTKSKRKPRLPYVVGVSIGMAAAHGGQPVARPVVLSANAEGELTLWVPSAGAKAGPDGGVLVRLVQLREAGGLSAAMQTARMSADATAVAAGFADGALSVWTAAATSKFAPEANALDLRGAPAAGVEGVGVSSLCWRAVGAPGSAAPGLELLAGSEGGECERWTLGGAASRLAQPALQPGDGEVYAMAACAPTGEVFCASADGSVCCLGM